MKTTTYTFYETTIIENIDFDAYGYSNDSPLLDKIKTLYNIFKKEYVHKNNEHLSEVYLFSQWLQGLPSVLTVPFYYDEILENATKYATQNNDKLLTKQMKKEEEFLNNYWKELATAFFKLKSDLK